MSRGAFAHYLLALFGQKENVTVYFSAKRRSLLHPNTAQRSFFPTTIFSLIKLKHKFARKARVYILSEYIGSCCVLNKFNMVTVSVRKCITVTGQFSSRGSTSLVQQLKTFSQPGEPTLNNPQTKLNRQ